MAKQKIDGLLIGRGNLTSNARSTFAFSSSLAVGAWNNTLSYPIEAVVEYSNYYYRSIVNFGSFSNWSGFTTYSVGDTVRYNSIYYVSLQNSNLNQQPDISPLYWSAVLPTNQSYWELLHTAVKDGDIAAIVPGSSPNANSDIMVRNNGVWVSLVNNPQVVTLMDNTLGQMFLSIPLAVANGATLEVSIDRPPNLRRSNLRYESDGTVGPAGVSLSEYNVVDIGAGNVGVTFTAQVNGLGTAVEILADTDSQIGAPIFVKYIIKGWA